MMGVQISLKNVGPKTSAGGVLDPDAVLVRFHTQQDERVRPSHAALEGRVFRLDDPGRPSPPLDYGCRCWLEYVAVPETHAERVLEPADEPPTTPPEAYADHLDDMVGRKAWSRIRAKVDALPAPRRLFAALAEVRRLLPKKQRADAKDIARMIVEAQRG
jgi:hypothetical protein